MRYLEMPEKKKTTDEEIMTYNLDAGTEKTP